MVVSQDNKTNDDTSKRVRDRLLDSAEELFCERGFEGASIRDIAASAECNIASVNYYFGGKEKLYQAVWRHHLITMRDIRIASIDKVMSESDGKPELEVLLRSFAEAFIGPLVDESRARRLSKLWAREMIDQNLPANMFAQEMVIPTLTAMKMALVKACPGVDESKVQFVVFSVVGQLVHLVQTKAMFEHCDEAALPRFDLAKAIDHIVEFSAAGIRAYSEGKIE